VRRFGWAQVAQAARVVISPEVYDRAGNYAAVSAMTRGSGNVFGAMLEIRKASDKQNVRQRLFWLQVVS
jgi:hypothetical protein